MSKIDTLTAGQLARAESKAGIAITSLDDPKTPKLGLLTALAYEVKKSEDPKTSYKSVEDLTLSEVTSLLGLDEDGEEDPKA